MPGVVGHGIVVLQRRRPGHDIPLGVGLGGVVHLVEAVADDVLVTVGLTMVALGPREQLPIGPVDELAVDARIAAALVHPVADQALVHIVAVPAGIAAVGRRSARRSSGRSSCTSQIVVLAHVVAVAQIGVCRSPSGRSRRCRYWSRRRWPPGEFRPAARSGRGDSPGWPGRAAAQASELACICWRM